MASVTVSLLAAVFGMLAYGTATVLQAAGAQRARGPAVLGQPLYLIGLGLDTTAWLASVLALQHLPLFTVQALLAGSLCVTVVLARVLLGALLRRRDLAAIAAVVIALVAVTRAAGPESSQQPPSWFTATLLVSLGVVVSATLVLYGRGRSTPMAVLAGIAFSGSALGARTLQLTRPWERLITEPVAWAIVGFGLVGAVTLSRALEGGRVGLVTAVLWIIEVLLPGAVGVLALGDSVRPGWTVPAAGAVAVAVAGCVILATSPALPEH